MPDRRITICQLLCLALLTWFIAPSFAWAAKAEYELRVVDAETGSPCSAKMRVTDSRGNPRRVPGALMIGDTAYFTGSIRFEFRPGSYEFRLDAGPEYPAMTGSFILNSGDQDNRTIELKRFTDMAKEGWYSGNLALSGQTKDVETRMMADDLVVGSRVTWNNQINPWAGKPISQPKVAFGGRRHLWELGGEDDRAGGKLWFANLMTPLPVQRLTAEYPAATFFLPDLRESAATHVTARSPLEPDLPMWVAQGLLDSVCILGPEIDQYTFGQKHPLAEQAGNLVAGDVTGKPRLALDVYYRLLESGIRLAPAAANGTDAEEHGTRLDRVYTHLEGEFSYDAWWKALAEGKSFVTNGPLLRASVEGYPPGHVFGINIGERHEFQIAVSLATRQEIAYLEIIKNGQKEHEISLEEYKDRRGILPPLVFDDSGWFLVRVVTQEPGYYQMATSAPFYVEANGQPRVSKSAAEFFRDWVFRRAMAIDLPDGDQRNKIVDLQRAARDFWQQRAKQANAP